MWSRLLLLADCSHLENAGITWWPQQGWLCGWADVTPGWMVDDAQVTQGAWTAWGMAGPDSSRRQRPKLQGLPSQLA